MARQRKDAPKGRGLHDARGVEQNPLTTAEADEVVAELCGHLALRAREASLLVLLLYALSNEHDEGNRSAMYYTACEQLAGTVEGIAEAYKVDHEHTLAGIRAGKKKGGDDA